MALLERAIDKLKQLYKKEQNLFVSMVLNEAVWQETFVCSSDKLDKLGKSLLAEIQEGKFKRMPGD